MSDFLDFLKVVGGSIAVFFFGVLLLVRILNELALPGRLAEIEQLRSDLSRVAMTSNEDAIGQATELNREIRSMQRYNDLWWADLFIPDEWADIAPIPVGGEP